MASLPTASAEPGRRRASRSAFRSKVPRAGFSVRRSGSLGKSSGTLTGSRIGESNHVLTPSATASAPVLRDLLLLPGIGDAPRQETGDAKQFQPAEHPAEFARSLPPVIQPEHDSSVIGKWLIDVHPHGNQVGLSVPIHVRRFQADEMGRRMADVMLREIHFAVVFEPDDAL